MTDEQQLTAYVETWKDACDRFTALARNIPQDKWDAPTDLDGWSVKDNVAHTAHLEAVLAGTPEETVHVDEAPHLTGLMNYYTEQGVLARRDRTMSQLSDEIDTAVARRYAALKADPPTDAAAAPPKTPGDVGWNFGTLLSNRPLDVFMHEQDIRRAIGEPGGLDSPAATHTMQVFARALPMVVGKRVKPAAGTTVRLVVPDEIDLTVTVGADGRASAAPGAEPTVTITMPPESFLVASGGRRSPAEVSFEGDAALGQQVVDALAVTP